MKRYYEHTRLIKVDGKTTTILARWVSDRGVMITVSGPEELVLHDHKVTEYNGARFDLDYDGPEKGYRKRRSQGKTERQLLGFQIVNTETDDPPDGQMTYEIYPLAFVITWFRKLPRIMKPQWRMLPIFDGDIDEPTFPHGR